jgi:hypothetical protein
MATKFRYRYKLDLQIKSTNKKEMIVELVTLIAAIQHGGSFGFGGDSGTCYADGKLTTRT